MKTSFYIIIYLSILTNGNAQCTATVTNSDNNQPVCSDQWVPSSDDYYNTGVIKVKMDYIVFKANNYTFSTVGETIGDTYLSLYDSNDKLLDFNDDDATCNCKQSTITYNPPDDVNSRTDFYLILSKPDCGSLDFDTRIKYNVRNISNTEPKIDFPDTYSICGGVQIPFIGTNNFANTWVSKDSSIATIDKISGLATFLKEGIARIQLTGSSNCVVVNNYSVHIATTSSITQN